jgi:hypothetical protein
MLQLLRLLDKAVGYAYVPPPKPSNGNSDKIRPVSSDDEDEDDLTHTDPEPYPSAVPGHALQGMTGLRDVADVQERWVDNREAYDEFEKERERREVAQRQGGGGEQK